MASSSSKPTTSPCLRMAAIFFLLFFTHTLAIRTIPAASSPSPYSYVTPNEDLVVERINKVEQSCEGDIGEEECLMRRTLAAHLDYIYTQKQNP